MVWANHVGNADRNALAERAQLPTGLSDRVLWLTEFEDAWPYKVAPADVYFSPSDKQDPLKREPIIRYTSAPLPADAAVYALAAVLKSLLKRKIWL